MKHNYIKIIAAMLLITVFVGCKKENNSLSNNDKNKQEEPNRSSSVYENANNPYDSIGVLHNAICQYVDEQFKENGFVLTNGERDSLVSYTSFYQAPPTQDYYVQIETILDYIDEFLFDKGLTNQSHELKSFCYQYELIDGERTIDIISDVYGFITSLQNYAGITSQSFQSQLTNLVFGTDSMEEKIMAAKNIESLLLIEQNDNAVKNELMLLSVYRHSSGLWSAHAENDLDLLPPWVGSDLIGLYSIFWYGASIPNPIGAGIIIGYTALCSAVSAYEFSR